MSFPAYQVPVPSAEHLRREKVIMNQGEIILEYLVDGGRTHLGVMLHEMTGIMKDNFNKNNSIRYRNALMADFNDWIGNEQYNDLAQRDKGYGALIAFLKIVGAYVEEMNDRTLEGSSILFQRANAESLGYNEDQEEAELEDLKLPVNRRKRPPPASIPLEIDPLRPPIAPFDIPRRKNATKDTVMPAAVKKRAQMGKEDLIRAPIAPIKAVKNRSVSLAVRTPIAKGKPSTEKGKHAAGAPKKTKRDSVAIKKSCVTPRENQMPESKKVSPKMNMRSATRAGAKAGRSKSVAVRSTRKDPYERLNELGLEEESADEDVERRSPYESLNELGFEEESADEGDDEESDVSNAIVVEWAGDEIKKETKCFQCTKICTNWESLSNHLYHAHKGISKEHNPFQCRGCSKKFKSYRGAIGHIKKIIRKQQTGCKRQLTYLNDELPAAEKENFDSD